MPAHKARHKLALGSAAETQVTAHIALVDSNVRDVQVAAACVLQHLCSCLLACLSCKSQLVQC